MTRSLGTIAMRRSVIGLALALLGLVGCLHAPLPWSPDGSWIAYVVEVRPSDQILRPGWLYDRGGTDRQEPGAGKVSYRLWATRAATNASVLLEDSPTPISAPGWSPDGHALAFGRVVTALDQASRFEVVILEGLTRRRVILSRPLGALDAEVSRLPFQAIAWSPDGRYLAVPQLEPAGLAIIRADNGRVVNSISDAFLPAWSPSGGHLAFYLRSSGHSLALIESALAQPRHLIDVGQAGQAPSWSRDGTSVVVVTRRSSGRPGDGTDQIDLVRVRIDNAAPETIRNLTADLGPNRDRPVEGTSITFDRDAENFFAATILDGQPSTVTWYRPRSNEILKKFTVVDHSIPVGSLSFSPDGRTLAARLGTSAHLSAPVLCDTETTDLRTRLVAPDDSTRLEWVATLTRAARAILATLPQASPRVGSSPVIPIGRPTILPLLTELTAHPEAAHRLKRIARLGRPLCDRPTDAPELASASRQALDEARLFFDYLREDYPATLDDLRTLETRPESPEHRLILITIRAQALINQGEFVAARRVVKFLERIDQPSLQRVEWAGTRYLLVAEPRPERGWPQHLADSLTKLQTALTEPKQVESNLDFTPSRASILFKTQTPFRPNPLIPPAVVEQPPPRSRFVPRRVGPEN